MYIGIAVKPIIQHFFQKATEKLVFYMENNVRVRRTGILGRFRFSRKYEVSKSGFITIFRFRQEVTKKIRENLREICEKMAENATKKTDHFRVIF